MDGYIVDQNNISDTHIIDTLEALDTDWQIFFIILYSLTSILAFCENLVVIVVQLYGKNFEPVLRRCLINLAVADICIGVLSVPFTYTDFMLGRWIFPHFLCPLSQFSILLSVFVTVHTLTLISLERYISIVHPLFHSSHSESIQLYSSALLIIGWILGSILSGLSVKFCTITEFKWKDINYYDCRLMWDPETEKAYNLSIFIFTFLLPLLLQTTFYLMIAIKIKSLRNTVSVDRIRIIKMLAFLVITFAICWLPIKLFFLVVTFNKNLIDLKTITAYHIYVFTYFIAHFLSMFNSCINPIIYCFMSKGFREDLWHLIGKSTLSKVFFCLRNREVYV